MDSMMKTMRRVCSFSTPSSRRTRLSDSQSATYLNPQALIRREGTVWKGFLPPSHSTTGLCYRDRIRGRAEQTRGASLAELSDTRLL